MLSTEQQNYAFDLTETIRVAIGRHDSNDLQLNSRIVSNYHAEILNDGENVVLHDLRSANGTFLNEERINQRPLKSGDEIRVGGHVLAVKLKDKKGGWARKDEDAKKTPGVPIRGTLIALGAQSGAPAAETDSHPPPKYTIPDLVVKLSDANSSVTVELAAGDRKASIYLEEGRVIHAECGKAKGEKALYRLLLWSDGTYVLKPFPRTPVVPKTIALPTESLVIEGMQQSEELEKLEQLLPPRHTSLSLNEESDVPLSSLSPAEIDVFQDIIRHRTIAAVVDESSLTDFRALHVIHSLLQKKVVQTRESESSLLEQTSIYRPGQSPAGLAGGRN